MSSFDIRGVKCAIIIRMDKYFKRRLLLAKNPRCRRHNRKHVPSEKAPRSHVEAFLDELANDVEHVPDTPLSMGSSAYGRNLAAGVVTAPVIVAGGMAFAAVADGIDATKELLSRRERAVALKKRRKYYSKDAERRQQNREIVCAAMKPPEHACPTPDELEDAYLRRKEADGELRFGTLMIDLEEHVHRKFKISGNKFTGSSGGVRDWLLANSPLLAKHYSTCQRYKRMAQDELNVGLDTEIENDEEADERRSGTSC